MRVNTKTEFSVPVAALALAMQFGRFIAGLFSWPGFRKSAPLAEPLMFWSLGFFITILVASLLVGLPLVVRLRLSLDQNEAAANNSTSA